MGTNFKSGTKNIFGDFCPWAGHLSSVLKIKESKRNDMRDEHLHWYQCSVFAVPQGMRASQQYSHMHEVRLHMPQHVVDTATMTLKHINSTLSYSCSAVVNLSKD